MRIILVENDAPTAQYATTSLTRAGHEVDTFANSIEALQQCKHTIYDLMIVDCKLEGMCGFSVIKEARSNGIETPVLFLTDMSAVDDRIAGSKVGGDDYLAKPFGSSELNARVCALGRKTTDFSCKTKLQVADLQLDIVKRKAARNGVEIKLQSIEVPLLEVLMRNSGSTVSRSMLLEQVWGFYFDPKTNLIETHIKRLRDKIDKPFNEPLLHNVRNVGYCLNEPAPH